MKSKGVAYLLWLLSFFGVLGFHRFYLLKIGTGLIWMFTLGVGGLGSTIDLFTLGGQVDNYNAKVELKTLRRTSIATTTKVTVKPIKRPVRKAAVKKAK